MAGKAFPFNDNLATTTTDILVCIETHFTDATDEAAFTAGTEFELFTRNRLSHGGGVAIAVKKHLKFERINYESEDLEALIIKNSNIIIVALNWPPNDTRQIKSLETLLKFVSTITNLHTLIIAGDLNLRGVLWKSDYEESPFLIPDTTAARPLERESILLFEAHNLYQMVQHPNQHGRFLDIALSNNPRLFNSTEVDDHEVLRPSHHHTPYAFNLAKPIEIPEEQFYEKKITNHKLLSQLLAEIPISFLPSRETLANIIDQIVNAFRAATFITKVKIKPYLTKHPWLAGSSEYRQLRLRLKNFQRSGDSASVRTTRIEIHQLYDELKEKFCNDRIKNNDNPNSLFNIVNFYRDKNTLPSKMLHLGAPVSNTILAMTDHLAKVFEGRNDPLYDGDYQSNIRATWESSYIPNENYEHIGNFTEREVYDELVGLDCKKDPGYLQISPQIIGMHAERLADILTPVFNACILIQWTPLLLLKTILVPIPKSGAKTEINNYRGIAISNAICKALDKLITKKLTINAEQSLRESQYGFRSGFSTTSCIFDLTQEIAEQAKWADRVDIAFIDFANAFDHIAHSSIVKALAKLGMPLPQTQFIMQFVNHRQYYVKVNGKTASTPIIPSSGIPQESCIGPAIFIIVANSIPDRLSATTKVYQYADDTVLLQPILGGVSEDELQSSITNLSLWAKENGMSINSNKSAIMKVTRRQPDILTSYELDGVSIPQVNNFRYLGVILDEKLNFNLHAQAVKERTCRLVYAAARLCKSLKTRKPLMNMYQYYVDPIVCYAAPVWTFRTKITMAAAGEAHRICTRLALGIPPSPLAPHYQTYADRCTTLNNKPNDHRMACISLVCAKKWTSGLAFSANAFKMADSLNEADANRRVQRPFVDSTHKQQYANTPLFFLLTVIQRMSVTADEWHAEWFTFKQKIRSKILT